MRNLKKLLAVVVTLVMVVTLSIPAFAADAAAAPAAKTDVDIAKDLGMVLGSGGGVTEAYLATQPTRLQGAIMFLRLKGLEGAAKAFLGTDNFADVAGLNADNTAILAYLKANPDLGYDGVGDNKFDPNGVMTAKQYYKVLLVALGYKYGTDATADFTWNTVNQFASTKGLTKLMDNEKFTISDLCTGTVEALKATVKGGTKTLLASLVDAGIVASDKAVATGIFTVVIANPAVVSVTADNLAQVVVTFNKAIDKDTIEDGDFVVDNQSIAEGDVSLSDDKKVATLKVTNAIDAGLSNGDETDIEISGISDVDGKELAAYEGTFTAVDNAQPKITAIEFTGPYTAKFSFSEPISQDNSNPEISIDGGIYSGTPEASYAGNTSVSVDIGSELDEGSHVFKIKGFEDYAGYSNTVQNMTVSYAKVTTAPVATVKEADQSVVTLTFNRPVTGFNSDDADSLANFYQSYSNWHPLEFQDADGHKIGTDNEGGDIAAGDLKDPDGFYDTVKLVFRDAKTAVPENSDASDRPLPTGTVKIVIKDEAVKDHWDNKNDGDVNLSATIGSDTTKPTVTKVTVEAEDEIRVYFSEDVSKSDAEDKGNYEIKDSKGVVYKSTKWTAHYDSTDHYTTIHFTVAPDKGDYTIKAEGIADNSLAANTLDAVTTSFKLVDKTASLSDVHVTWVDGSKVMYVKYGDDMATTGSGSVLNKDNYRLDGDKLDSDVRLSMFTTSIVKMQFPADDETDYAETVGTPAVAVHHLMVGNVSDLAGNLTTELADTIAIGTETAPVVKDIKKIANNKFEITVDQDLKSIGAGAITVVRDWDATPAPTERPATVKFENSGDDTKITITVPSDVKDDTTVATEITYPDYRISIHAEGIKSITGVWMPASSYIADTYADSDSPANHGFADGVAPALAEDGKGSDIVYAYDTNDNNNIDHIIIKYSEAINPETVSKYTYLVDGYDVKAVTVVSGYANAGEIATDLHDNVPLVAGNGAFVVITVDEIDSDNLEYDDTDATPDVTQRDTIEDLFGNKLEAQDPVEAVSYDNVFQVGR